MTKKQFFLKYAKGEGGNLVVLTVFTLLASLASLASPQLVKRFLDEAQSEASFSRLVFTALVIIGLALVGQAFALGQAWLGELVAGRSTNRLREDLARHCLGLDMGFHKVHKPGELLERVDSDVNETRAFFSSLITDIFATIPLFVGVIVCLAIEDWRLGAGAFLVTGVALIVFPRINKARTPRIAEVREVHAQLSGDLQEWIQGREDIQASSSEAVMLNRLERRYSQRYKVSLESLPTFILANVVPTVVLSLAYALAYTLSSGIFGKAIEVSSVAMVLLYLDKLQQPIYVIQRSFQRLSISQASFGRIAAFMGESSRLRTGTATLSGEGGIHLRLEGLGFGYDDRPVLSDISLELKAGERLGLLGRTGSGKTTLTRLLMHLYEPDEGSLLLGDGTRFREPRELEPTCLKGLAAMVTQDVELFHATVRNNLTLYDPSIPDEAVLAAVAAVSMDEWLSRQGAGLDTMMNGPAGLSAGEAQLLSLARVFLRQPGLVILDEASSRLDPATERRMEKAVSALLEGRTAIIIAHRLETVQRADRIAILEQGRLVEEGPRAGLEADPASRFSRLLRTGVEEVLA